MYYWIAADFVVFAHLLWIAFVSLGFPVLLYLNRPAWRIFHLIALVVMIVMQATRTVCPLTYLEIYLKSQGQSGSIYPGQFMIDTIEKLIYVEDLTLEKIMYATIIFLIVVLLSFWFRPLPSKKDVRVRR